MGFKIMPTKLVRYAKLTIAAILTCCALNASANQLVYGGVSSYSGDGLIGFGSKTEAVTNFVGALGLTDTTTNEAFWVYCLDPKTAYTSGSNYTKLNFTDYFSSTSAGGLNYTSLFSQGGYTSLAADTPSYAKQNTTQVMNNLVELYSHAYQDSTTGATWAETALKSAAFQFAVWEILGDSTYSRTSGGLHSSTQGTASAFQNQVDIYLNSLNNDTWASVGLGATTNYTYTVYASTVLGTSQNFLRVTAGSSSGGGGGGSTPEPASAALLLVGAFAWSYAKKSSKKQSL